MNTTNDHRFGRLGATGRYGGGRRIEHLEFHARNPWPPRPGRAWPSRVDRRARRTDSCGRRSRGSAVRTRPRLPASNSPARRSSATLLSCADSCRLSAATSTLASIQGQPDALVDRIRRHPGRQRRVAVTAPERVELPFVLRLEIARSSRAARRRPGCRSVNCRSKRIELGLRLRQLRECVASGQRCRSSAMAKPPRCSPRAARRPSTASTARPPRHRHREGRARQSVPHPSRSADA